MLKKLISKATMICLGATVFSGIITPMAANASERDIPKNIKVHKEAPLDYSPLISPLDKKTKVRYIDKLVDNQGDLVFCLQHEKDSPSKSGVEYKVGNKLDSGLNWIIKNFYTGKEYLTGNKNLDYYITSKAIHVYTGQSMLIDGKKPIDPKHVLPKINSIVEKAKKIKSDDIGKIDAKITLKSIGEKYKFENNKFISPTYIIDKTGNGTIGNIKLEVSNSKAKIFVNGKETSSIKAGEKFTIEIPENEVKDNEKIKVTAKTTVTNDYDYSISYSPIGNSKVQKVGKYVKGIVNTKDLETEATAPVKGMGKIQILKVDEEREAKLEGAEFQVKDKITGKVLETLTTNKEGIAVSNWYPVGTELVIKETKAPGKYILNEKEYTATINSNMQTIEIKVPNKIMKGRVQILKVDEETGAKLEGAKFELKDKTTGKVLETLTTDKEGLAVSNYYNYGTQVAIKEVKAPAKYTLNGKEYFATITENMKTIEITVQNKIIKGTISIHKVDSLTKKPLQGVEFNVLDSNNKVIEKLVTDKDGNAKTKELNYGEYRILEVKTNKYYNLNEKAIDVSITENKDYSYTVENKPTTGRLLIKKTDIATGKELEGAKIKITCIEGLDKGKVIEFISGKTAKEFELKAGKYTYEELIAPKGYEINKSIGTFEITKEGQIVKCSVEDKAIRKPTPKLPHTGYDYKNIAIIAAVVLVIAGVVIISRKKNNNKK
ncbi:collagen binding domain-containing protein [Eubacterium multiforme]|nr:SpaA isopeptide-forming pilin-related protein [Eubacterium multiforme]